MDEVRMEVSYVPGLGLCTLGSHSIDTIAAMDLCPSGMTSPLPSKTQSVITRV